MVSTKPWSLSEAKYGSHGVFASKCSRSFSFWAQMRTCLPCLLKVRCDPMMRKCEWRWLVSSFPEAPTAGTCLPCPFGRAEVVWKREGLCNVSVLALDGGWTGASAGLISQCEQEASRVIQEGLSCFLTSRECSWSYSGRTRVKVSLAESWWYLCCPVSFCSPFHQLSGLPSRSYGLSWLIAGAVLTEDSIFLFWVRKQESWLFSVTAVQAYFFWDASVLVRFICHNSRKLLGYGPQWTPPWPVLTWAVTLESPKL